PIKSDQFFLADGNYLDILNPRTPIRLTVASCMGYYLLFASLAALVVHTILFNGKDILKQSHTSLKKRQNDIHCTLISKYPEAPEWAYALLFLCAFICACFVCHYGNLMPWYYQFLCASLAFVCLLPSGIVTAQTNMQFNMNYMLYVFGGVFLHGKNPIWNSTFSTYSWAIQNQALNLLINLKFGHYMKISPRAMFSTQLIITILSATIRYGMAHYLLTTIVGICTYVDPNNPWECPNISTTYAIAFGKIG
ncbi:unnamed protein product, partial [Didymodactylos carnosus]